MPTRDKPAIRLKLRRLKPNQTWFTPSRRLGHRQSA